MAYLLIHNFHFRQCRLVTQQAFWEEVAFRAEVVLDLVEVHRILCASSMSADLFL